MTIAEVRIESGFFAGCVLRTDDFTPTGGYVHTALYNAKGEQIRTVWSQFGYTPQDAEDFRAKAKIELESRHA